MTIDKQINRIMQYPNVHSVSLRKTNGSTILFWSAEVTFINNSSIVIKGGTPQIILGTLLNRVRMQQEISNNMEKE